MLFRIRSTISSGSGRLEHRVRDMRRARRSPRRPAPPRPPEQRPPPSKGSASTCPRRVAEADDEVPRQRHPVHRRPRAPGHLHPHHRQQDRQPAPSPQHRRAAARTPAAGSPPEPRRSRAPAQQPLQRPRPLLGGAARAGVRQLPGQPVQFDLGAVNEGVRRVLAAAPPPPFAAGRLLGLHADEQAQQGEVGALLAGRLGEAPPVAARRPLRARPSPAGPLASARPPLPPVPSLRRSRRSRRSHPSRRSRPPRPRQSCGARR